MEKMKDFWNKTKEVVKENKKLIIGSSVGVAVACGIVYVIKCGLDGSVPELPVDAGDVAEAVTEAVETVTE